MQIAYFRFLLERIISIHLAEGFNDLLLIRRDIREECLPQSLAHQNRLELVRLLVNVLSQAVDCQVIASVVSTAFIRSVHAGEKLWTLAHQIYWVHLVEFGDSSVHKDPCGQFETMLQQSTFCKVFCQVKIGRLGICDIWDLSLAAQVSLSLSPTQ